MNENWFSHSKNFLNQNSLSKGWIMDCLPCSQYMPMRTIIQNQKEGYLLMSCFHKYLLHTAHLLTHLPDKGNHSQDCKHNRQTWPLHYTPAQIFQNLQKAFNLWKTTFFPLPLSEVCACWFETGPQIVQAALEFIIWWRTTSNSWFSWRADNSLLSCLYFLCAKIMKYTISPVYNFWAYIYVIYFWFTTPIKL